LGATVLLAIPALLGLVFLGKPTIHALFQHGRYGALAGALTYDVLLPYAVALPAYVATEVITRGLIALRDTRTPLITNRVQLAGRTAIMAVFLGALGVRAIPVAFAVMASIEAVTLGAVLAVKMQRRVAEFTLARI
jgi:putative peptidoglycan lipid II flippase